MTVGWSLMEEKLISNFRLVGVEFRKVSVFVDFISAIDYTYIYGTMRK